jgi:hypothetical protein
MNANLHVDQGVMTVLYRKYKAVIIPFGIIALCLVIILFFVWPQFSNYLNNRDSVTADLHTIDTLNTNITTVANLDESSIDKDLIVASAALPSEKDFAGILNAISQAASIANVTVGDYSFQIGNLFGGKTSGASEGQLNINITLSLTGDLESTKAFMDALSKEFPLSEVENIASRGDGGAQIQATFFYNPLPQVVFNPTMPIAALSPAQKKLMDSLSKNFLIPKDLPLPKKPVASESAQQS